MPLRVPKIVLVLLATAVICHAQRGAATAAPTMDCKGLAQLDLSSTQDAPTKIASAQQMDTLGPSSTFCQVSGHVAASIEFLLVLPLENWNGKLLQLGCNAFCGSAQPGSTLPFDCDGPLRRGYACIISDNGHRSTPGDALWAYNNVQAEIDHGFAAVHSTALAGRSIVERYYGRAPGKSYFMGSSTGGRQALMAAQRFPWDFDGIVAGVPSVSVTGVHMNLLWGNRAFTDEAGRPLFTQDDLNALHQAVVAECDLNDGIKDDLIGDPRACHFDAGEVACSGDEKRGCLSARQVEAVRKVYRGASTSSGDPIYTPGALKGSENTWLDWFSRLYSDDPRATYNFVGEQFRYSAFQPDPGPAWMPEQFDFDRDYKRLGIADALSSAANPDLRKFNAAGGKLIVFAGWSDAGGMPLHTVDYYETVERTMRGRVATQAFFRLFMLPGVGHAFGEGAFAVDWLSYLEAWVERGQPPDQVISFHVKIDDLRLGDPRDFMEVFRRMAFPLDTQRIEFSRPVYPYPVRARYRRGDPRDAASFAPIESPVSVIEHSSADASR